VGQTLNRAPVVRDLVLVGGGHSHALLIRKWGMQSLAGVRLSLISRDTLTPYSGFLPGLLAGQQSFEETHIDLRKLCHWAGVRFIEANMTGIDLSSRTIQIEGRPAIGFDLLSLDTGSTPDLSVPGASEFARPVKPVHEFYAQWQSIQRRIKQFDQSAQTANRLSIGIVGSGAGGFELIMAMRAALPASLCECHWFLRSDRPLKERPRRVSEKAMAAATKRGVVIHLELDEVIWCTGAIGPDWPTVAGLATDHRGFVQTNAYLQSTSHSFVFASGDIGTQQERPNAKAGVFAVRQAPVLFENLRAVLLNKPLRPFVPQSDFLSLMITGDENAIGNRGHLVFEGKWVWRLKQSIDGRFMRRFRDLPQMPQSSLPALVPNVLRANAQLPDNAMSCLGCGAKISSAVLDKVLSELQPWHRNDIIQGLSQASDAAVFETQSRAVVQSVDQISAIVDDPWLFGRIAALHALSDVATLDAEPQSAQALVTLAVASEAVQKRELSQLMQGVLSALDQERCSLIGGHSAEGPETSLGLVINALSDGSPHRLAASENVQTGHDLILTQSIGIGVLFAGLMQGKAHGVDISRALQDMQQSNVKSAEILREHAAIAMTDVTGFGLLEHLHRLLANSPLSAQLRLSSIPLLPGAVQLGCDGVFSSLLRRNQRVLDQVNMESNISSHWLNLLCDPQTGGGLLAVVPSESSFSCVEALVAAGFQQASIVGQIVDEARHRLLDGESSVAS